MLWMWLTDAEMADRLRQLEQQRREEGARRHAEIDESTEIDESDSLDNDIVRQQQLEDEQVYREELRR